MQVLGPYFEGGSCQTPWGMIPRNLTVQIQVGLELAEKRGRQQAKGAF